MQAHLLSNDPQRGDCVIGSLCFLLKKALGSTYFLNILSNTVNNTITDQKEVTKKEQKL